MTRTADLLTVLHTIDNLRGKVCGSCKHASRRGLDGIHCARGYQPFGEDDGCDDWGEEEKPFPAIRSPNRLK
jgi:hypothetical protein